MLSCRDEIHNLMLLLQNFSSDFSCPKSFCGHQTSVAVRGRQWKMARVQTQGKLPAEWRLQLAEKLYLSAMINPNDLNGLVSSERHSNWILSKQWRHWEEVPAKPPRQHGLQSAWSLLQAGPWRLSYVLSTVMKENGGTLFFRCTISWWFLEHFLERTNAVVYFLVIRV